jgi:nucleolar protein 6
MAKSSKKRERTDEDVAENHDTKPVVKKSKLDSNGKAEVTKKSSKVKEAKPEATAVEETSKPKKEKKDKKDKKEKKEKKTDEEKAEKKEKKDKKRKAKELDTTAETDEAATPSNPEPATEEAATANGDASTDKKSKSKKDKKDKKDKKKKSSKTAEPSAEPTPATNTTDDPSAEAEEDPTANGTANGKSNRFICFVGNLPFTATADAVREHFATLQPTSVRLLTQRDQPTKSRGIAFVEFAGYDHMKTCLKKFHHTEFDDGKSAPRRINVELTYVFIHPPSPPLTNLFPPTPHLKKY